MIVMLRAKIEKPASMPAKEFYGIWKQEAEAAMGALNAGVIQNIWKVAGKYEVCAVMDLPDGDSIDAAVHDLPIWRLGHSELVTDIEWTPLRPYSNWAEQLKELAAD